MTERLIGETGSRKRRRFQLLPVAAVLGLLLLMVASQATAADPDAANYTIVNDENGANDVPGQKDLTLQERSIHRVELLPAPSTSSGTGTRSASRAATRSTHARCSTRTRLPTARRMSRSVSPSVGNHS